MDDGIDIERDACGVGFVADVAGRRSHAILAQALAAVAHLRHRGAVSADGRTGDGAGVLTQLPYELLRRDLAFSLPPDRVAAGMVFLPRRDLDRARALVEQTLAAGGLPVVGWRAVPTDPDALGDHARGTRPEIAQVVVARPAGLDPDAFERVLYLCRRRIERRAQQAGLDLYIASLSGRTMVYKALLSSPALPRFYPDLTDPAYATALAVFHQRYSTNTFPSWRLAQPFRLLAHNGEINTLTGNVLWMRAREASLRSALWDEVLDDLRPVVQEGGSDSAMLDNVAELLALSGRRLPHVLAMLVPQAWEDAPGVDPAVRAFYAYHACLTEPWDGPAALAFSDGTVVGGALDRNGLRPARYLVTRDGRVILASEAGVLDIPPEEVAEKGRLGPGQMLVVDTARAQVTRDPDVKAGLARRQPYGEWVRRHLVSLPARPAGRAEVPGTDGVPLPVRQRAFGYTAEEVERILRPMVRERKDPVFSMGDDTPPAVLAQRPRLLYHYFKQRFAQVTNPPIDPLRERAVMSLAVLVGPRPSLLEETPEHARLLRLPSPVLLPDELRWICEHGPYRVRPLLARFPADRGVQGLRDALAELDDAAAQAAAAGELVLLRDGDIAAGWAPIPMLLAVGAVHHGLIRRGLRMQTAILVETAEAREVHHLACLVGYGASAVCPILALQTLAADPELPGPVAERWAAYRAALEAGLLKVMSKMGISTVSGYCGAQVFEAVGLCRGVVETYFSGTPSRLQGIGLEEIAADVLERHRAAWADPAGPLPDPGLVRFRRGGEYHAFNPYVVKAAHRAAREGTDAARAALDGLVTSRPPTALRDLLEPVPRSPIPLEEVEPAEAILRRFVISAMSFGALSREAHEALAIAANRVGARNNCGEGGEDPRRYGTEANSRIKQIASARFGVTPAYILSADELEIKMAQGSKPGEGGQLPGHKVSAEIARIRRAQPGITLISPPPHHDIYSIEDLAQLIYDLRAVHPRARVAVKLVASAGVGAIAAGVAKAGADTIQISGHDGGTGASPLDSIKNAGVPWELGLAEVQQVLVRNDLRARVRLRVDGGLKVGRDVVVAACLGADEFGFGTAAVVALGCVMARQCHLNTCPVGIATQREDLRRRFSGTPEMVVAYLRGVAEDVRRWLARLGVRSLEEVIGRVDLLRPRPVDHPRARTVDLRFLLTDPDPAGDRPRRAVAMTVPRPDSRLDRQILADISTALEQGRTVDLTYPITTADRAVGARLAGALAERYGDDGVAAGTITLRFRGSAGQSFGAFLVPGVTLILEGEANDYVGKGMAGGEIIIRPPAGFPLPSEHSVIMGNTVLYGATGGRLFAAGRAGERCAVRNSGAVVVVEGVGDHGCEYMTGGIVVVLGEVGRNFAAGMTGGVAYVLDEAGVLPARCNPEHVTWARLEDPDDEALVLRLLAEHARLTGSRRAEQILRRWDVCAPHIWKVTPLPVASAAPAPAASPTRPAPPC
ncbi:MAG: glutamate synthase large subunit [Armatimonadota bacterium]|nr:glutamate synthase large subunit [Armatimonadota bacterium]